MRSLVIICTVLLSLERVDAQWVQTQGPEGGGASAFARLDQYLFVGLSGSGVCRSTDKGDHWTCSSLGLTNGYVNVIAIRDTEVIIGTYGGIFLSTNHGSSWSMADSSLQSTIISDLLFYQGNGYATTSGRGVLRSTDKGRSWHPINSNIRTYSPTSLGAKDDRIFVSANGVYISTNEGENWFRDGAGLPFLSANNFSVIGGRMYAAAWWGQVCYTTNNGDSWTNLLNDFDSASVTGITQSGPNLLAATEGQGVFASNDSGVSWRRASSGLTNRDVQCLYVDRPTVFAGTTTSVFRSMDNGESWTPGNTGIINTSVTTLEPSSGFLFAGTRETGIFRTSDAGESWVQCNAGLTDRAIRANTVYGINLFVGTAGGAVFRSANQGLSWSSTSEGLPGDEITALERVGEYLFAGTSSHGVFRSTDKGSLWTPVNDGLTNTCISTTSICISALSSIGDTVLAGAPYGVFRSTDSGLSWTHADSGLNGAGAFSITVHSTGLFAATHGGIFRSTNGGRIWSPVNTPDPGVLQLRTQGAYLAATCLSEGVFISSNSGQSWVRKSEGLTDLSVRCICFADSVVFVGTDNMGVWRRPFSEFVTTIETWQPAIPLLQVLEQNYPNPFNPVTVIQYSIPKSAQISLAVYDVLGRQIAVLESGFKPAGRYAVNFDASNVASGVYIYRLEANESTVTRKMVVVR